MDKSVFDFSDYKDYLQAHAKHRGARSGFKTELANAAGCNLAYLSAVLNGNAHLSLEQAERLNSPLHHTSDEAHAFLLLVQSNRAGTPALRQYFNQQLHALKAKRANVKERLGFDQVMSKEQQSRYYSSWTYAAIHVALSIPDLRTPPVLARYFQLPLKRAVRILEFLTQAGLAVNEGSQYKIGPSIVHLGNDADQIVRHHTNWRTQAIARLDQEEADDLHYSGALTISREDAQKIKDHLLSSLKSTLKRVEVSKEEEVFALNLDFFHLRLGD